MARITTSRIDGGGDSFYSAVDAARSAANVGAAAPRGRTNVPSSPTTNVGAAAPRGNTTVTTASKPAGSIEKQENAAAARAAAADKNAVVDEQSQAKAKAAQARNQGDSQQAAKTYNDPYYTRDPITGYSPAQVEALQAQKDAAIAKAEAIAEYYRLRDEAAAKAAKDGDGTDGDGTDGDGTDGDGTDGDGTDGDGNKGTGADTTVTGAGASSGAGGSGPDNAAQQAILDQIKALTEQMARQQAAAAAEAAKPKVIGTRTVRKTGGVVEVVELMSDGSQGKVIESYKDFGARDSVMKMFENTGLGQDFIKSLMDTIDKVYDENIMPTDAQVLNSIYSSDAYKQRFAANEAIRKRLEDGKGRPGDRLLSPAEYIKTEQAYQEILQESGMPTYFYDQPEDFTRLIENSISVAELTSRVNIAQNALQKADQGIVNSLKNYYGLSTGDLVAYLLDNEKAWDAINSRYQYSTEKVKLMYTSAEVGGAAERAGMGATVGFAEEIAKAGKAEFAERAFQGAARDQRDYERLMGLYGETSTKEDLAREALALAGGAEIGVKTKKLASKERAKFQQRSAIDKTSLGSRLRTPDV
jgi:hypothetical protein